MNERLVEDWLSKASERSYQTPFAQSLVADGMQVLRVGHSSHEHGKDIVTLDASGKVQAYQLKEGDLDINGWEKALGQITALVETQVEHPAIRGQPRHQPWLVISGRTSIPVDDRIRVHNLQWQKRSYLPLQIINGAQLLARFAGMASNFWPQKPGDSRNLLSLYLADGKGTLDRSEFARLIVGIVRVEGRPPKTEIHRRLAAANVFASYALSPFYLSENHWELVQGWTITAAHIAWCAEKAKSNPKTWYPTFRLAVDSALAPLDVLCDEALQPSALDPQGYELDELTRSRSTICAGLMAAKILVERRHSKRWEKELSAKRTIEQLFISGRFILWGESAVPCFLLATWALDGLRGDQFSDQILLSVLSGVTHFAGGSVASRLPNPYDSADEANAKVLRRLFKGEKAMELQAAASYSLEPLVSITARRLWRNYLASLWSQISKIDSIQLVADKPRDVLLWNWGQKHGRYQSRRFGAPQSWSDLLVKSRTTEVASLPDAIKDNFDFEVLFLLCFPHRLTRALAKHLEDIVRSL